MQVPGRAGLRKAAPAPKTTGYELAPNPSGPRAPVAVAAHSARARRGRARGRGVARGRTRAPHGRRRACRRPRGLWRQHRLRKARADAHRARRAQDAAAQSRALPRGGRGRTSARRDRPPCDGAESREPGARVFRACAAIVVERLLQLVERQCAARDSRAGFGRRVGRSRAARPSRCGSDRRRPRADRRPIRCPRATHLRQAGIAPLELEAKEGLALAQRHAGFDRACACGALRGGSQSRSRAHCRRALDRRGERQRHAVRCAHP